MKKKDLLNITLPDVPEELIETARSDKYANNEFVLWNCQTTVEKSYKTRLYFGASEENGILIVRMWPRILLAQESTSRCQSHTSMRKRKNGSP